MKRRFAIILLLWSSATFAAKHDFPIYEWEEVKNASPDTVYGISFEKMKLEKLPDELAKFVELRVLLAGKNKLTSLPEFISSFSKLEELNLEKNDFKTFPGQVCALKSLRILVMNRNEIAGMPSCIGSLSELVIIDLYDNPIMALPESLTQLTKLKEVDLSGIRFKPAFQEKWRKAMPDVYFDFDPPCDCM